MLDDASQPALPGPAVAGSSPTSRSRATCWSRSRPRSWPATRSGTGRRGGCVRLAAVAGIFRHGRRALLPAPAAARPRRRRLRRRQAAAHGGAAARDGRLDAVRTSAEDRGPRAQAGRSPGRSPGSSGRSSSERLSGWYPYPFLDHREEHGVPGVVISIVGITAFFLASSGWRDSSTSGSSPRRRRGTPTAEVLHAMTDRPDRPHRPSERHRLRRVRPGRRLVGAPAPLRPVRPRRLLRLLPGPARHRALPGHRAPGDPELRARRGLVLGLPHRRAARRPRARRLPPRVPRTRRCPARPTGSRPTGAAHPPSRPAA